MADDKMKLELEVDIQVQRAKQLDDLQKKIDALNDKVAQGDKDAIKSAKQLTDQKKALLTQIKLEQKAIEEKARAEKKAAEDAAKAEKKLADERAKAEKRLKADREKAAKAAEKATADQAKAEKKAEKERAAAARQQKKDDNAAARAAAEKVRLEIEHAKERRKSAKEARLAAEGEQQSISRTQRAKDRATRASIKGYRDLSATEKRNSKASIDEVVKRVKSRRSAEAAEIKSMGQRFRMVLGSQRMEEALQSKMFAGFRKIQQMKDRMQRAADRAAGLEKRTNDTRMRNDENALNTQRGLQQYMQRYIGLSQFKGKIEQRQGREAMRDLRNRVQGAQMLYNAQMNFAKQSGKWDAQAEQRIQSRYNNEIKSARRAFTTKMAFAREEQRESDRNINRGTSRIKGGYGTARDGFNSTHGAARNLGVGTLAAGAATGLAIERGIESRMNIDTAETKLRMFGGTGTEKMSQADVVKNRKEWLDQTAIKNGLSPAGAINAFTEVLKADIPTNMAQDVTKMILEGVSGADMPLDETTKLVSRLNYLKPSLGVEGLKRGLNDTSVAAAVTGADPNEIVSSLRRGAGALAISPNMSFGDLAALTGVGISTGMQEGQAGTFMEHQLRYAATAKYQGKHRKKELAQGYKMLGLGSLSEVQKQATEDGAGFLERMFTAVNALAKVDINKANKAADFIGGEYWAKNFLMMGSAADSAKDENGKYRNNKVHNAREAVRMDGGDHLDRANQQKINSWQGLWNSSKTVFSLMMDDFGKGFNDLFRDVTEFTRDFGSSFNRDGLTKGVEAALNGIKQGLGITTWKKALSDMFGIGGGGLSDSGVAKIRKFSMGFTQGVLGVVDGFKSLASAFGMNTDPKALGKLAGQIAALSVAALALSPVLSLLGGLVGVIKLIGGAGRMMFGAAGIGAGLMARGGTAAVAGTALRAFTGWAGIGIAIGSAIIDYIVPRIAIKLKEILPNFTHGAVESAQNTVVGGDNFVGNATTWILDLFRNRSQGHATGGWVSGPGGPTSDSVMARLSNGEFVVNASAAQRNRGLLEAINNGGMPGFAMGGSVGSATPYTNGFGMQDSEQRRLIESIIDLTRTMKDDVRERSYQRIKDIRGGAGGGGGFGGGGGGGNGGVSSLMSGAIGRGRHGLMGGGSYSGGSVAPRGNAAANFASLSPKIMGDLQKDFGLDKESAAAIMGNLGHESAGMTAFQEGNPRGGGRGGWGWAQWTGPRRRAFEQFAQERGLDPKSYEANYGFLKHELNGTHRGSLAAVKNATGLENKTIAFENSYEAAGVKHYDRRIGYARTAMGLNGDSGAAGAAQVNLGPAGNNPADAAARYLGMGENNNRSAVESFVGHDIRGAANAWCARFVNSSLAAVGQRGTGSAVANSFLRWGQAISADMIQKGDVMVEHRNKGVDGQGGHVGISTGRTRRGRSGELEMEMISGNSNDQVQTSWERASKIAVRRNAAVQAQAATQGAANAMGTPQGPGGVAANQPGNVSAQVPIRPQAAAGGGGGGQGGGNGPIAIHINGHNKSPQELAAEVQRHLQDSMNRRTHDYDGFS